MLNTRSFETDRTSIFLNVALLIYFVAVCRAKTFFIQCRAECDPWKKVEAESLFHTTKLHTFLSPVSFQDERCAFSSAHPIYAPHFFLSPKKEKSMSS